MTKWRIKLFLIGVVILAFGFLSPKISAQSNDQKLNDLNKQIEEYQKQVQLLQSQAATLSNQVRQFDAQIKLTSLKISQTEESIVMLGGRIDQLEGSLDSLTAAFSSRVVETYKMARFGDNFMFLVTARDISDAVMRQHYLKKIQEADGDLMVRLQKAQNTYKQEKTELEKLQETLNAQKKELDNQKKAKAQLLAVTKNDEKKYQQLLASARAEYEAIQAIVAGKGTEEEVGQVNEGSRIASIIQGASCNSSGAHLHFIVSQDGNVQNPFNYLKPADSENCSGSSCGSGDGDAFNPGGSWEWPISPRIKFTQGFGSTWGIRNTWVGRVYSFHNGIDINSGNPEVRATRAGKLFRGSYGGSGSCRLRYVRVDHDENNIDTYYLHINY